MKLAIDYIDRDNILEYFCVNHDVHKRIMCDPSMTVEDKRMNALDYMNVENFVVQKLIYG